MEEEISGLYDDLRTVLAARLGAIGTAGKAMAVNTATALSDKVERGVHELVRTVSKGGGAPGVATTATTTTAAASGATAGAATAAAAAQGHTGSLLLRYVPLTVSVPFLLVVLWPLVLALAMTFASASSWCFWLLTSVIFGFLQLGYVVYQFLMISIDIYILSLLKGFATLRSQIRYYTVKSGLSSSQATAARVNRRGRRREWRKLLNIAHTYADFCNVEVQEPHPEQRQRWLEQRQQAEIAESIKEHRKANGWGALFMGGLRRLVSLLYDLVARLSYGKDDYGIGSDYAKRKKYDDPLVGSHSEHGTRSSTSVRKADAMNRNLSTHSSQKMPRTRSFDLRSPQQQHLRRNSFSRVASSNNFQRSLGTASSASATEEERRRTEVEKELGMTGGMLISTTERLRQVRLQASDTRPKPLPEKRSNQSNAAVEDDDLDDEEDEDENDDPSSQLKFLLTGVVKRNHLSVDDVMLENARSVAECGQHRHSKEARSTIEGFNAEVERCLDWVATSRVPLRPRENSQSLDPLQIQAAELSDRMRLVRKLKHNMGRTALMLSGGGAQALYHVGTIRALVESGGYSSIKVVSGTSGGAITAAMCATKNEEELLREVCIKTVATDFRGTGEMKRRKIRWFPPLVEMGAYWWKHKLLVDSSEFRRCCEFYYGDVTFEEAFQRTGKHVCITVSASRAGGSGVQRLLLNHISTPHVTLSSAVAASCALPGVMAPAKLYVKDTNGNQLPFEVDGVEWIDGSVQADLPFQRISTLFNVSNYIVCQANFHVVPFLHKAHHPDQQSWYWRIFQTCEWDIRNRALNLSRLGLFPRIFGQDISKVFSQKYHGKLTLVPRFTTMQVFGLKALVNPTEKDMEIYLQNGQSAAWPYIYVIKEMLRIETTIDKCLAKLEERHDSLTRQSYGTSGAGLDWSMDDEVESISSGVNLTHRGRLLGASRETDVLRRRIQQLQTENESLKKQVAELRGNNGGPLGFIFSINRPTPPPQSHETHRNLTNGNSNTTRGNFAAGGGGRRDDVFMPWMQVAAAK